MTLTDRIAAVLMPTQCQNPDCDIDSGTDTYCSLACQEADAW